MNIPVGSLWRSSADEVSSGCYLYLVYKIAEDTNTIWYTMKYVCDDRITAAVRHHRGEYSTWQKAVAGGIWKIELVSGGQNENRFGVKRGW